MKRTLLTILFFLGLLASQGLRAQQDINFSQFYELPLLRNPALAGIFNGNVRFTAAYRNQWESITVPYRTMALGSEFKFFKGLSKGDFITAGLQITNDVAGDSKLKRTQFFPVINYHKTLNEENNTFIAVAFMGGAVNESFDASKLQFDDQFVNGAYSSSNPTSQSFTNTNFNYMDASTGISFSSMVNDNLKFYIGTGLFHFTKPKLSFMHDNEVTLNKKWVFNTGISAYTSTYDRIVVYADHFRQGGNRMTQGGFLFTHNFDHTGDDARLSVSGGAVYRWKDAMIPVVKINTDKLSIGFSYDVNTSKLRTASSYRGGFELTLSYMGIWGEKNRDAELVECPIKNW